MNKAFRLLGGCIPLVLFVHGTAALAQEGQDKASGAWSIDAGVALVSDYKFRGISLSDKHIAVQPELNVSHESGFYAFFWGSTLADNGGANVETDVGIGFAKSLGPVEFDVNATWYLYPDVSGVSYVEIITSLSTKAGPATIGAEFGYAPPQANLGNMSNRYAAINASVPLGKLPLALNGSFGVEDGAFGDSKLDWSLGVSADVAGFTLGATYVDAARHGLDPLADPTVVLSIKKSF